jgi:hypothetical protein
MEIERGYLHPYAALFYQAHGTIWYFYPIVYLSMGNVDSSHSEVPWTFQYTDTCSYKAHKYPRQHSTLDQYIDKVLENRYFSFVLHFDIFGQLNSIHVGQNVRAAQKVYGKDCELKSCGMATTDIYELRQNSREVCVYQQCLELPNFQAPTMLLSQDSTCRRDRSVWKRVQSQRHMVSLFCNLIRNRDHQIELDALNKSSLPNCLGHITHAKLEKKYIRP